ncbi:hypothetical protein [Candidatus Binatus sp.]|uniref:hypothetical protein n=1 Tax=Candidatus Binatus sp. TaxID=2811406 RepID=UPI002F3F6E1D
MKTKMFRNKIVTAAFLGAAGAIALCAQQAFAFGMMGGAAGAHVGGSGSGRFGSAGMRTGASGMAGAVTMNGITVLPNGALIVPAVTPRVPGAGASQDLGRLDQQQTTGAPCRTASDCTAY